MANKDWNCAVDHMGGICTCSYGMGPSLLGRKQEENKRLKEAIRIQREALEKIQGHCGIPSMAQAIRCVLDTTKEALKKSAEVLNGDGGGK